MSNLTAHTVRRATVLIAAAAVLAFVISACGGNSSDNGSGGASRTTAGTSTSSTGTSTSSTTPPDDSAPSTTAPEPAGGTKPVVEHFNPDDWPVFGRDRDNTRYAPQTQINSQTVGRLGEAWSNDLGGDQFLQENFPIEVDGVLYVTTSTDEVYAFDAATGAVKWKYAPRVNFSLSSGVGGYGISVNRGVAVANGKVYLLTFDAKLQAISAATGELDWSTTVDDARTGAYETMSPTVYDGQVFVGNSGSDQGVRGFVAAYDARTGRQNWRFYTIPPVGTSWRKDRNTGGGTVYMAPTVDTETGNIIVGTSNPSPAIVGTRRPGRNPYTSSIVALNATTGRFVWAHQEVAHDLWDYDAASPVELYDTTINGRRVRVAAEAGKSGYLFMLDARTGRDVLPRVAFVRENHTPPTTQGTLECPGPLGGSQYDPMAYSPRANATYVSGINDCYILRVTNRRLPGESHFGGTRAIPAGSKPDGTFDAVDVSTGRFLWQRRMPTPMGAGATATASDIVFTGDQHGVIYAMDARTGRTLWQGNTGLAVSAAPIVYTVGGKEYVAVAVGGSGLTSSSRFGPIGSRIVVLALGGRRVVPVRAPSKG